MSKKPIECCPLFTEAVHAKGSFQEGFLVPTKKGERWQSKYVFHIAAKGRRSVKRAPARNLILLHCPFCGAPPKAAPKPEVPKEGGDGVA